MGGPPPGHLYLIKRFSAAAVCKGVEIKVKEAERTNKGYEACGKDLGKDLKLIDIDPELVKLLDWCKKFGYL